MDIEGSNRKIENKFNGKNQNLHKIKLKRDRKKRNNEKISPMNAVIIKCWHINTNWFNGILLVSEKKNKV